MEPKKLIRKNLYFDQEMADYIKEVADEYSVSENSAVKIMISDYRKQSEAIKAMVAMGTAITLKQGEDDGKSLL